MSYPYSDPERYDGLLEHVQRHLGPVIHGQSPTVEGRNRGFAIGVHAHPDGAMVSAASTGVRFQRVTATLPQEYVCSARPGQDLQASYLVHLAAENAVETGKGMRFGGGFLNAEPLMPPDTRVQGFVAAPHPYLTDGFDLFHDAAGEPALQFVTLVPVTTEEVAFLVAGHTADELFAVWERAGTDLLDMSRASAVT